MKESLFQGAEMVDHQNALQVVEFMLNCDAKEALGLDLEGPCVAAE